MVDIIGLHPGAIAWRTNPDNADPYKGQAALVRYGGGGVELIVTNGRTTANCIMPAEDAGRLRQVLGGEDDTSPVESLVVERDEARAQLWALREELRALFQRGVMPTPDVIMRAVHEPDERLVRQYLERSTRHD